MDKEVRSVTNITELILALYDQVPTLKVTGPLANNLYYASRNLRFISVIIVVLFTALCSALAWPNLMVPVVIICLGLLALFSLPLIFLFMAQVSLRTLSKVRRNYRLEHFDGGSQELYYRLRVGEPVSAQGERNLRSLRLVLPRHYKFKFRPHATAPQRTLSPLADLAASESPEPAPAAPEPAPELPEHTLTESDAAAPKSVSDAQERAAPTPAAPSDAAPTQNAGGILKRVISARKRKAAPDER